MLSVGRWQQKLTKIANLVKVGQNVKKKHFLEKIVSGYWA